MADQVVRGSGEGTDVWMLGGRYTVKVSGEESGGELTVMEMHMPAHVGPPPHTHPGGETVYVLEGTLDYHIDGKVVPGKPGDTFYIPAGTMENFVPTSELRILATYTPGGVDKFFLEVGETPTGPGLPPPMDGPPPREFLQHVADVGSRYGMDIALPPE